MTHEQDIFDRMKAGEPIRLNDPEFPKINAVVNRTIKLYKQLLQFKFLNSLGDTPTLCLKSLVKCCGYLKPNS